MTTSTLTPLITSFCLGDFMTNCHVVTVPDAPEDPNHCWVVDCGFEPLPMIEHILGQGLEPQGMLLTHAHSDHIAGIDLLMDACGKMPIWLHEAEKDWCQDPMLNLSAMLGGGLRVTPPDHLLKGGETLTIMGTDWRVLHTPGHSPGSVVFLHDESHQAIVGDTLFEGSIGRHDFPTSNVGDLRMSISEVLMALPDETRIFPGHGGQSDIGTERRSNPFVLHGF